MVTSPVKNLEKYRTAVILRDGSTLYLRAIKCEDEEKLLALFSRLRPHTIYLRFHRALSQLSREEARLFCTVDYDSSFGLVGTVGEGLEEKIVAAARYYRLPSGDSAEVAFIVEDAYQGRGIGTHLLEQLATIAREQGIRLFEANVLLENQEMLKVVRDSGFRAAQEMTDGIYRLTLDLAPLPVVEERSAGRERTATTASLKAFLKPRSIAVIGASRHANTIGNKLFHNILRQEFQGVVYPVNPNTEAVASVRTYPSVLDIPGDVDLAVVIVPASLVSGVVEQCGRKGVRGIVVISAGFAESGPEGLARQDKLVETARSYGMRLVGPNCMGIINTDPAINLNATFSSVSPPAGRVAFATQSGALGLAILEYARNLNIGLSTFVSIGNRADVSSNDLLQYWQEDPVTSVILLYLESFGNPKKFARIARSVTRVKPVVAVKSGRTPAGSRAAASHTGALATTEVAADAIFDQVGVVRVDMLEELFDVANLLANQPIPRGRRVAILTNGGGPGIMTADACAARGLEVAPLAEKTVAGLQGFLRREASLVNPIDMTAEASAQDYSRSLKLMAEDEDIDIAIVIFVPPILTNPEAVARAIREVAPEFRKRGKTLVASFMGVHGATIELSSEGDCCVPSFVFPEATALALAKACQYSDWLKRPPGTVPQLSGTDKAKATEIVVSALERSQARPLWLDAPSVNALLGAYGIRMVKADFAHTAEEAMAAAERVGYPAVMKLVSDTIIHKTEVGGVILDLHSRDEIAEAFERLTRRLASLGRLAEMKGVTLQQMVTGGVEIIVGMTEDVSFGPLLMFGLGGVHAELFKDVVFRIHPLTDVDAQEMVRSVKAYQLLQGWRGARPADIKSLEELLLRVSAMVEDLPQLAELDLNPVMALEEGKGYVVVDARIRVA
ncbi:MAG: GNAT family N-acetyltransferase [Chloroflexi bacterium]|nr:GNAT family N-acetyltransferase [Chloroflexota bacterium]